jgi:hypothetical protein
VVFVVKALPAVETNFDRVAHQMTLAHRPGAGVRNNCPINVVARVERQAHKGAQFRAVERLVALASEF